MVKPDTYRRWRQEQKRGKVAKSVGRPPMAQDVQELIVRFATENSQWGYGSLGVGQAIRCGYLVYLRF